MAIQRKEFLVALAGGALLGACGGGDGDDMPAAGSCGATISNNHGHSLIVPPADLDATTPRVYSIFGAGTHDHTVTLSATQLAALKAGQPVTVTSTAGPGHEHDVMISCV